MGSVIKNSFSYENELFTAKPKENTKHYWLVIIKMVFHIPRYHRVMNGHLNNFSTRALMCTMTSCMSHLCFEEINKVKYFVKLSIKMI